MVIKYKLCKNNESKDDRHIWASLLKREEFKYSRKIKFEKIF